ncbi:hypothetical protein VPHK469_0071 [Vibrio phage K469]
MPNYRYKCGECEHDFNIKLHIKDRKQPEQFPCPSCDAEAVKMVMAAPKVVSGVTTTDKIPQGFKDVMSNIKKTSGKDCTIDI